MPIEVSGKLEKIPFWFSYIGGLCRDFNFDSNYHKFSFSNRYIKSCKVVGNFSVKNDVPLSPMNAAPIFVYQRKENQFQNFKGLRKKRIFLPKRCLRAKPAFNLKNDFTVEFAVNWYFWDFATQKIDEFSTRKFRIQLSLFGSGNSLSRFELNATS